MKIVDSKIAKDILLSIDSASSDLAIKYNLSVSYVEELRKGKVNASFEVLKDLSDLERRLVQWRDMRERFVNKKRGLDETQKLYRRNEYERRSPRPI